MSKSIKLIFRSKTIKVPSFLFPRRLRSSINSRSNPKPNSNSTPHEKIIRSNPFRWFHFRQQINNLNSINIKIESAIDKTRAIELECGKLVECFITKYVHNSRTKFKRLH